MTESSSRSVIQKCTVCPSQHKHILSTKIVTGKKFVGLPERAILEYFSLCCSKPQSNRVGKEPKNVVQQIVQIVN